MNVVILNGNSLVNNESFNTYLQNLKQALKNEQVDVKIFNLNDLDINYCSGCWTCWWKTPGVCMFDDEMISIYKAIVNSELLIMASPMVKGFETALLKKTKERLIPLIHPYLEIREGECHHKKRYANYPRMVYLTQTEEDTDEEDLTILKDIQDRMALNFHSKIVLFETIEKPIKNLVHEIINN